MIGQVKANSSIFTRYYYLKDHLGSIRMTVNSSGDVVGYDDYYPFGKIIPNKSTVSSADNRYRFTSKERDSETNYDYFGARYYDSKIGRWLQVDPLAEKYPGWSPYNYGVNNPLRFIDLKGMGASHANVTDPPDPEEEEDELSRIQEEERGKRESLKRFIVWQSIQIEGFTIGYWPPISDYAHNLSLDLIEAGKTVSNFGGDLGSNIIEIGAVGMLGSLMSPGGQQFLPEFGTLTIIGAQLKTYNEAAHLGFVGMETLSGGSIENLKNESIQFGKHLGLNLLLGPIGKEVLPKISPELNKAYEQFFEGVRAFIF
jgi:RHS repeat-associated protein